MIQVIRTGWSAVVSLGDNCRCRYSGERSRYLWGWRQLFWCFIRHCALLVCNRRILSYNILSELVCITVSTENIKKTMQSHQYWKTQDHSLKKDTCNHRKEHVQERLEKPENRPIWLQKKVKKKRNVTLFPKTCLNKEDLQWHRTVMTLGSYSPVLYYRCSCKKTQTILFLQTLPSVRLVFQLFNILKYDKFRHWRGADV